MKKLIHFTATSALLAVLIVAPVSVSAQDGGVIEVGGGTTSTTETTPTPTTTLPTTGGSETTPAAPKSGIAPTKNKLAQNALVFLGGGALGAGLGLGIIAVRKKNLL